MSRYILIFQLVYIYWLYKVILYEYKVQNKNTYSDGPEVLCMTERVCVCFIQYGCTNEHNTHTCAEYGLGWTGVT